MTMASAAGTITEDQCALIVCDLQLDALNSIPDSDSLVDAIQIAVNAARRATNWTVVWSGLRFPSRYEGVSPNHKLYGALVRLNSKVGDVHAHWFMEGYEGSEFVVSSDKELVIWRSSHLPSPQLVKELTNQNITKATVVGIKAGYAIQSTVQALCDAGIAVSIIQECVADDNSERMQAVMNHLIPIYANVMSLANFVDTTIGLPTYVKMVAEEQQRENKVENSTARYISDCKRGGHCALYAHYLLKKSGWRRYPLQPWYTDHTKNRQYICPLGKRIVDFCDEPQFSKVSMYLKGREWLDEKEKVVELAGSIMPETYVIEKKKWLNDDSPISPRSKNNNTDDAVGPWFVKECDKNGGRAVQICRDVSECMGLVEDPDSSYVVQAHICNPLLTTKGHKCHVKFYSLLQCMEDGVSWTLYTYKDAFLCVSPNPWSADDVSAATQVTIKRHVRLRVEEAIEDWTGWPGAYAKCQESVATVVRTAVSEGKLQGRSSQKQFELFSADFLLDTTGKAWLIEFNFGPVLFDPTSPQDLTTTGLQEYQRLYKLEGKKAQVNDAAMIRDAVQLVFFPDDPKEANTTTSRWELAGTFQGNAPVSNNERNNANSLFQSFASIL